MKNIEFNRFKGGKKNVITTSYDDGTYADIRLIEIFNKYGIKGTFNINSKIINNKNHLGSMGKLNDFYKGHEIACHGGYHRSLTNLPKVNITAEIWEDKKELEKFTGRIIRGMAFANGRYSNEICNQLEGLGMEYCRTINSVNLTNLPNSFAYDIPNSFLKWHPSCHHQFALERVKDFKDFTKCYSGRMLYIWGHAIEFDNVPQLGTWQDIEEFCKIASDIPDVWFATNIEIVDYINAIKSLKFSAEEDMVYNPSALALYFTCDDELVKINPGEQLRL